MVAVSTTLSASEFTENAGITQSATNTKQSFRHRLFAPRTVVLDPAATLDTPDWLLFCTGIRAVDHAVETYCNARAQPGDGGAVAARLEAARSRAAGHQAGAARSGAAARGAVRHVAGDCGGGLGHSDRAPATASAMRWAPPSALRTGTPPA